jgi:hypothetical protein
VATGTIIVGAVIGMIIGLLSSPQETLAGILVGLWLGWSGGSCIAAILAVVINKRARAKEGNSQL